MSLKLGMVGGGRGAFIGGVHRIAARLDGHWELVAGAFSSDPTRAATSAAELGIVAERSYGSFAAMAKAEAARPDCIDAVAIVTPNHLHVPIATAFLRAGIPVICDKPLATTVKDAEALVRLVTETGIPFILTQTYTGYPMVREARALVAAGRIGHVRHVQVEYLQDWLAEPVERGGQKQAAWRADPAQSGAGGCIADIGTHAFNLATFVSGLVPHALLADLTAFVPGRALDDNAALLLRFEGGAKGMIWASQVAPGTKNGLRLRVVGEAGGLMWDQEHPDDLEFTPIGQPTQSLRRGGEGVATASRLPAGHPEGYLEAFATLYAEAAGMVRRFREGAKPDQATMLPTVTDGLAGMRFISAGVRSHEGGAVWINL
ncbi:Gfo/Idh/MocA family oxidoreductase [Loktanella salsilacus]|jgi:predicted dehydrogenase|uniref:Gfo/Idh/MocA family protein n=1 Tax=Loktanella salsilacus TaxID=195913 RepID=UPI0020B7E14A|nr:Gfo/Idh/MocA family oxidoreductase [Loktanella salsilacus]MBU0781139.1 Gfo/Idh/MocA family oxidoreductase [Alphaproteobacteria bacterium]MBU1835298.1 Gfo/Idh/MocA family oxidoreductase [Alphaproteobacteria bacterium]UTH48891.1 Gfo/Idh/MocA family oxidoreductase [Loktanella salsilacus]|tara:strand:+ start:1191 stop:2315 length:1125 start_codon:yes stop_codon:yes gene_type:complete